MNTEKFIYSRDQIPFYLPQNPKFVVLGTMAAINARHIEGSQPPKELYFFYNNDKNRFWRYMWQIFEKKEKPTELNVQGKKIFCETWGLAMCNLVEEMHIYEKDARDRKDGIIFKANENGRVKTKTVSTEFKIALRTLPIFFTCYHKKELQDLLELFFSGNGLELDLVEKINYLHTPAMPGRVDVLSLWTKEFQTLKLIK